MPTKLRTHLSRVMLTDLTDHANPRSNAATTATAGSGGLKQPSMNVLQVQKLHHNLLACYCA